MTTPTTPDEGITLGASLDETVIEELVPGTARAPRSTDDGPLLEVRGLRTSFHTRSGVVRAVDGIDFQVRRGEIMGLVGESGCGKSVTSLSILGLVPKPGKIEGGEIIFDGTNLVTMSQDQLRRIRGERISMVFQQPTSALNPVWQVGKQISEVLELHRKMKPGPAWERSRELLRMVGIPDPDRRLKSFPHEMSGGMAQRVMIAMALACEPELLIADEPTTALDVTIQAQILELLGALQRELGMSILLISHDLGVVAETCDEVIVMYAGRIVERARTEVLFAGPRHHYTAGLLRSVPSYGEGTAVGERARLVEIKGMVPSLSELPAGCKFVDRCPAAEALCRAEEPPLIQLGASQVRCHFPLDPPGAQGEPPDPPSEAAP